MRLLLLFSHPVGSDSLWPHGLQHTRPPFPQLSPTVCPNSCPLDRWCHLILWPPSRITALSWLKDFCNSMKLWAMPCRATQEGWVIAESSDQMWSTRGEDGKPSQCTCRENPMNCIERQMWVGPYRRLSTKELILLMCGAGEDCWESFGLQD